MRKQLLFTICALLACFASYATIVGPTQGCSGTYLHYSDSAGATGVFHSSDTSVAYLDSVSGLTYAVGVGTTTISFTTTSGTTTTLSLTINPTPVLTSAHTLCMGSSLTVISTVSGGTFVSDIPSTAVVSSTGVVTPVAPGLTVIEQYTSSGCYGTDTIVVTGMGAGTIMTPSTVCLGSTVTIVDSTSGGVWSVSNPAVATITSPGAVSGVATLTGLTVGTITLAYTVPSAAGCAGDTAYATVSVINTASAGTISGTSSLPVGGTAYLSSTALSGTWSVSPSSVATIDAYGALTALSAGSAVVTYTVSGCGATASTTYNITVTSFDGIAGMVNFGSGAVSGVVKVWLIDYAAPMLTAVDSTTVYVSGTSVAYQFNGTPTGNYRVKAAIDTTGASFGYLPTYHTNSYYWSTATVIAHTLGTADLNKDIAMGYGAITTGAGFIGGDVTTGANKGTASGIPAVGLNMYLYNSTSATPLQMTKTDAAGHYSFGNLPVGVTYYVFPEALNYTTVPYSGIGLTASAPSKSGASFVQHTLSHTITPVPAGISILTTDAAAVMAFPNPTTGKVSLTWQLPSAQDATVTVSDITGREMYTTAISMAAGSGISQINLSVLNNGLYTISVKSADLNYNSKLQVQH